MIFYLKEEKKKKKKGTTRAFKDSTNTQLLSDLVILALKGTKF